MCAHLLPLASMALRSWRVRRLGVSGANSSITDWTASMLVISTCNQVRLKGMTGHVQSYCKDFISRIEPHIRPYDTEALLAKYAVSIPSVKTKIVA